MLVISLHNKWPYVVHEQHDVGSNPILVTIYQLVFLMLGTVVLVIRIRPQMVIRS